MLSENTIKKAALRFLKGYYKYREREGQTIARYDMTTQSGIIADGHLSFPKEDGSYFLATFEATSHQSRKEVIFRKQTKTLLWDSLALASVVATLVYGYGYLYDHFTVKQLGIWQSLGIIALVLISSFLFFLLIFHQISRYRYIYAIEQFKKYHADEQWIVVGSDVFKAKDDLALRELKKQCVYGGFGMISVSMDETAHLMITPAREQVSKKQRKSMFFSEQNDKPLSPTRARVKNLWQTITGKIASLLRGKMPKRNLLLRYKKPVYRQIALFSVSVGLISMMFYQEIRDASLNYVNERAFSQKMEKFGKETKAEGKQYVLDSTNIVAEETQTGYYDELYYKNEARKAEEENTTTTEEVLNFEVGELIEMQADPDREVQIFVTVDGENTVSYDCARFHNFRTTVYLVEDAIFMNADAAIERMKMLRKRGIEANLLWLGCFSKLERSYIVYIDLFYEVSTEAQRFAKAHRQALRANGIPEQKVKIRSIPPLSTAK
ncbi:MAG: hypothetical protein AB8G15_19060 [Saprospiraceae bacterium]